MHTSEARKLYVEYEPNPKQHEFHFSNADECVYGGAKGGGKSAALVVDAFMYALSNSGAKIYLFRESYDALEANLIEEMLKRFPQENYRSVYVYNMSKHIAHFKNKSKIYFRFMSNLKDAKRYQGREMDYVGVDELTKHSEEMVQEVISCLRSPKGFKVKFRGTCNPGGIGHNWVKRRYIVSTTYGKKKIKDKDTSNVIQFIPAKVYDNKVLMENDPKYVKRLENLPPMLRKAFLEGSWDIFEGQAFEEFSLDIHVVSSKGFVIPKHWRKWVSVDNGYTDPFAWYWFAVDEQGTVYIYREFTRDYSDPKLTYSEQAEKVVELSKYTDINMGKTEKYIEKLDFIVAGHDAWNPHPLSQGKCIIDYYNEGGLSELAGFVKAVTDRRLRKATWHEYLKAYEDENTGVFRAKVVILDCCKKLIETIPEQIVDEHDIEKVAETNFDHWYDSAGYGLIAYHVERSKTPDKNKSEMERYKERVASRSRRRKKLLS